MKRWKMGSFTVEAAMIMGIVLMVIMAVLQGSNFIYERTMQTIKEYEAQILEKEEDPSPITYARRVQTGKDIIDGSR